MRAGGGGGRNSFGTTEVGLGEAFGGGSRQDFLTGARKA